MKKNYLLTIVAGAFISGVFCYMAVTLSSLFIVAIAALSSALTGIALYEFIENEFKGGTK